MYKLYIQFLYTRLVQFVTYLTTYMAIKSLQYFAVLSVKLDNLYTGVAVKHYDKIPRCLATRILNKQNTYVNVYICKKGPFGTSMNPAVLTFILNRYGCHDEINHTYGINRLLLKQYMGLPLTIEYIDKIGKSFHKLEINESDNYTLDDKEEPIIFEHIGFV